MRIDVDKVLRERLPKQYRYIPRFVVRWLERTICQDRLNAILVKMAGKNSVDAATAALNEMDITVEATGLEQLPEGRFMFVSNHPLGGLDGLALISLLGNRYDKNIKFLVNDLLMAVEPLRGVFLPVNKYGSPVTARCHRESHDRSHHVEVDLFHSCNVLNGLVFGFLFCKDK